MRPGPEAMAAVSSAEVYFGWGMPAPLFHAAPRLRWVQSALAGTSALLAIPEMREGPCLFTNAAGVYGPPIAEHVLAEVLHLTRAFDVADALRAEGQWDAAAFGTAAAMVRAIGELRVLVVGTGGLGSEIGARFATLGARVAGLRCVPSKGCPPGFARVAGLEALDEEALCAALTSGHLRGAVLDVFAREPLAPDSPLWQLRQVLLTPHVSGVSPRRLWDRLAALFLGNWQAYAEGRPLRNLVDRQTGY